MSHRRKESQAISRRTFLKQMQWAPVFLLPAPIQHSLNRSGLRRIAADQVSQFPFSDIRLTPHYPAKSPLDGILRLASPGADEYVIEGFVSELTGGLKEWSRDLKLKSPAEVTLGKFVDPAIQFTSLIPVREFPLRPGDRIEVLRREFGPGLSSGRERFVEEMKKYLGPLRASGNRRLRDIPVQPGCRLTARRSKPRFATNLWVRERTDCARNVLAPGALGGRAIHRTPGEFLKWSATEETVSRAARSHFCRHHFPGTGAS